MDSYKKELIGALTPEQVAVPRKPAPLSVMTPRRPRLEVSAVNEAAGMATGMHPSFEPRRFHLATPRAAPTALKPLAPKRRSTDRLPASEMLKKETMNELCPDQFMTVTQKSAVSGRRESAESSPSAKQHGVHPSVKAAQSEAAASASTSNNGNQKRLGHFMARAFHHKPRSATREMVTSTPSHGDKNTHAKHFIFPTIRRKGRKKEFVTLHHRKMQSSFSSRL